MYKIIYIKLFATVKVYNWRIFLSNYFQCLSCFMIYTRIMNILSGRKTKAASFFKIIIQITYLREESTLFWPLMTKVLVMKHSTCEVTRQPLNHWYLILSVGLVLINLSQVKCLISKDRQFQAYMYLCNVFKKGVNFLFLLNKCLCETTCVFFCGCVRSGNSRCMYFAWVLHAKCT